MGALFFRTGRKKKKTSTIPSGGRKGPCEGKVKTMCWVGGVGGGGGWGWRFGAFCGVVWCFWGGGVWVYVGGFLLVWVVVVGVVGGGFVFFLGGGGCFWCVLYFWGWCGLESWGGGCVFFFLEGGGLFFICCWMVFLVGLWGGELSSVNVNVRLSQRVSTTKSQHRCWGPGNLQEPRGLLGREKVQDEEDHNTPLSTGRKEPQVVLGIEAT